MKKELFYNKLKKLLEENNLLLVFKRKSVSSKILTDEETFFKDMSEKEFTNMLTSLLKCFVSNGNSEKEYIEYVQRFKKDFPELSDDILIKFNGYLPTITVFDIKKIKTEYDCRDIESYLINLNFTTSLNSKVTEKSVNLEVSKKDIKELINKLQSVIE